MFYIVFIYLCMHVNILQAVVRMQFVLVLLAAQESHTSPLCHIFSPNLKMRQSLMTEHMHISVSRI